MKVLQRSRRASSPSHSLRALLGPEEHARVLATPVDTVTLAVPAVGSSHGRPSTASKSTADNVKDVMKVGGRVCFC